MVEIFGEKIGYDAKGRYHGKGIFYHGVSSWELGEPNIYFHGPLSTSQQLEVPTLFTDNEGVVLALKHDDRRLKLFNACLVSPFAQEDERLFMGGAFPLRISIWHP